MSNSPPLKTLIHTLWKPNYERQGIQPEFKPCYTAYIGVEDQNEYNNILATLVDKAKQDTRHTLVFDNTIPFEPDFEFMGQIKNELQYIDVTHFKADDIIMFPEPINQVFLQALQDIVLQALQKEAFPNDSVRNNFITKLLLHVYHHVKPLEQASVENTNKCIYYGNLERHNAYFLLLLSKMNWDVLYINPLKAPDEIALIQMDLHQNHQILPIESLTKRANEGTVYQQFNSVTLGFEQEMEQELFTDSGFFRPWQFRNGTTKNLFFNSTLIDLENNWNEEARMRQGFAVHQKTVSVPNFFYEIEGEYHDTNKYKELVQKTVKAKQVYVSKGLIQDFLDVTIDHNQLLQLTFCQLNDGSFDPEQIKTLPFYKYSPFNDDTENFILNKINETLKDPQLYIQPPTNKTDQLEFVGACLQLNKQILRLIDSFDFPFAIPKIIIFLDKEDSLDPRVAYILGFLHKVGFDILVYSPAGMSDLSSILARERFNQKRLETINYERTYESLQGFTHKGGFFSKLFGV